jgi:hypothetical protein
MFLWWVGQDGYQWVNEDETQVLSAASMRRDANGNWPDCHLEPVRHAFKSYDPSKITVLFRTFADILLNHAGMLAFANEYGHLGDHVAELGYPIDHPYFESKREDKEWWQETRQFVRLFDPISDWNRDLRAMRRCVKLWDGVQNGRADESAIEKILNTVNE